MMHRTTRQRLRKQPKRKRLAAQTRANRAGLDAVPKTAQKRRRRQKTEHLRTSLSLLRRFIFNSRWISLGLLALCVYALVVIAQEKRFYLTYIPVEGAVALTPDEVVAESGLAGQHIFAADPRAAAERIGAMPGVISATVTLQWPNQVYIEVAEEMPIAIWREGGTDYGVTSSGRLIPALFADSNLLQIVSEMRQPLVAPALTPEEADGGAGTEAYPAADDGTALEATEPEPVASPTPAAETEEGNAEGERSTALAFVPAEVLHGALQLRELRPDTAVLYYRPAGGLSYDDDRGWRGYFGTGSDMNQKLALYETIAADLLARGIQPAYISVSNQEKPYYRVR